MNATHRRTLAAIFSDPVPANLRWSAVEALLVAIGCAVVEGSGSRVKFAKDGKVAAFHRPHTRKEAKQYQVREVREFLLKLGVGP